LASRSWHCLLPLVILSEAKDPGPPPGLPRPLGALLGIAAAARWPNLWLIPAFSDETLQAQLAVAIYRGQEAPLTNYDPYVGAFWNYLVAGAFWVFGLNPWLPRLVSFVAGVATVGATWWLGREIGGRIGGAVAAAFMATNAVHILVNSHVGSSHAIMPLFTTLGFACLVRTLRRESRACLVGAGALLGLAVQTHVTAVLLLPAAAVIVLRDRRGLLRTRWAALSAAAFLLATANLVVYNVMSGGGTVTGGLARAVEYTGEEDGYDVDGYTANLRRLALGGSWVLSGAIEKRRFIGESLADPLPLLYLALAALSVVWAAWRGRWLPLAAIVPSVLLMPLLNPKYEPLLNGRYLVPLLPFVYAAVGLATGDAWRAVRARPASGPVLGTLAAIAPVALATYPLVPLAGYQITTERTNRAVIAAYETVLAHRQPDETVLLDAGLGEVRYMAAGSAFKSMELLLDASDVPYVVLDARASSIDSALAEGSPRLLLLHGDKVTPLGRRFALTPLGQPERGAGFGVYRVAGADR
jgi:4-amino-4-deoxy-L-arabinose transferase-like glycosyltransferase